jgi:hypothetical protein
MTTNLTRDGVRVEEYVFSQAGANRLAKTLFIALRDHAISLPDDPELTSELQTVRLVETGPGTVKLVNPAGTHDDLAVAVGMCVASLAEQPDGMLTIHSAAGRGWPGRWAANSHYDAAAEIHARFAR